MVACEVFMRVPIAPRKAVVIAGPYLDEADTAFKETTRSETFATECVRFLARVDLLGPVPGALVDAVHLQDARRFFGNVQRVRRGELHLRGELVAANPCFESII